MLILFSTLRPIFWHKAANHFDKWQCRLLLALEQWGRRRARESSQVHQEKHVWQGQA